MAAARHACFAVVSPGLEAVVAAELARTLAGTTGAAPVAEAGGVVFETDAAGLVAAHRGLSAATRVLVRVGSFTARDFARLVREAAGLDWRRYGTGPVRLEAHVTARRSRLFHTGAIEERLAAAIGRTVTLTDDPSAPVLGVWARVEHDVWTLSVDASGERLHRRGWRLDGAKAPLRETLAAGILALAGWTPARSLLDPMCGSGTFVLEAAARALARPPGGGRGFACEVWPEVAAVLARAAPGVPPEVPASPSLVGTDRDPAAIAAAQANAARAELAHVVRFEVADAAAAPLADAPGLIVANPPYGKRIGDARAALGALARLHARAPGWTLAVLTPDARAAGLALGRSRAAHRLDNGGLRVTLLTY